MVTVLNDEDKQLEKAVQKIETAEILEEYLASMSRLHAIERQAEPYISKVNELEELRRIEERKADKIMDRIQSDPSITGSVMWRAMQAKQKRDDRLY